MGSSDQSYQDATGGSQVPLRTRSSQRALSPRLGPSPPSGPIHVHERHPREPQRVSSSRISSASSICVSSSRTSSTSSIYIANGSSPAAARSDIRTLEDPIMPITSTPSLNLQHEQGEITQKGHKSVKKLEEDLKHCLSGPTRRRVVSDTTAARATRAGRMINDPGRGFSQTKGKMMVPKRVENATHNNKKVTEIECPSREGTRVSVSDEHAENKSVKEFMATGPRRAISLRAESRSQWSVTDGIGIRRLSWLGRRKLVEWGMGVYPRIVYASDSTSGSEDGLGGGLTGTVLCRMGSEHRVWDVVRRGQSFVVRVVGSYMSDVEDVVVYSIIGNGKSLIHSRRTGSGFVGVTDRAGRVCDEQAGDVITFCVGVSAGGREVLGGEVRWRLGGDEDVARSGAVLLRFGYYFFLREATGVRLYTTTHTPEHVRLVARRVSDGTIDEQFSASLTYVVVRIAAD